MASPANPATTTITVFTRHAPDCPKKDDRYWKRCNCRKSLYIYENGVDRIISARTRSWAQAEQCAKSELAARDPVERELQRIKDQEEEKRIAALSKVITVGDALARWASGLKGRTAATSKVHATFGRKVQAWATRTRIEYLNQITPDLLDEWRGQWAPGAAEKYDRMGDTTQSHFQSRLKGFLEWATQIHLIEANPSAALDHISTSEERTHPLTPLQFEQLIAAVEPFTATRTGMVRKFAGELRAIFLVQRWTGLRIGDVLQLPRSGLVGNRLSLKTQKTGAEVDRPLPEVVVRALAALSPNRPEFRPEYFFWLEGMKKTSLLTKWGQFITAINPCLKFIDEQGKPLKFRSHQLRDTFAIELLLAGWTLEDVSRLLTHDSIKTTETYYGRWNRARLTRLEDRLVQELTRMGAGFTGR
jgi:integrase/recombinase XerD